MSIDSNTVFTKVQFYQKTQLFEKINFTIYFIT